MNRALSLLASILTFIPFTLFSQGNCDQNDLDYIAANLDFVTSVTANCGADCLFAGDPETCFSDCFSAQVPLTDPCIGCFAGQTACATDNCFLACVFGTEADCAACIEANCLAGFNECAGIYDNDNDGSTSLFDCDDDNPDINPNVLEVWYDGVDQNCDGLNDFDQDGDGDSSADYGGTDCDDTNALTFGDAETYFADADMDGFGDPTNSTVACAIPPGFTFDNTDCDDMNSDVYPGAPGLSAGIDNNCNGVIDPDEVLVCIGDLDNDLAVGANDLLIFLSVFGCSEMCDIDLDGDDAVGSSDLLIFLSAFGSVCF